VPNILADFNQIWSLSTDFNKKSPILNFANINPDQQASIK
jgi:hypothetical protein